MKKYHFLAQILALKQILRLWMNFCVSANRANETHLWCVAVKRDLQKREKSPQAEFGKNAK